jgi:hypothetical protein
MGRVAFLLPPPGPILGDGARLARAWEAQGVPDHGTEQGSRHDPVVDRPI